MNIYDPLIESIKTWSEAYPLSVFPDPPPGEHGETIDTCSARMGRHIISRLMDIIDQCEKKVGGGT